MKPQQPTHSSSLTLLAGLLLLLLVLLPATNGSADTFTATNNAGWNTPATWDPNGIPGTADTAIIPAGRTVTYAGTPSTIGTILISGTFTPSAAGTFGDVWVDTTGILNITVNGGNINFSGNVTNLGAMPTAVLGSAAVFNYTGTGKVLAGNISNVIANITGSYQNVGQFVTGLKGTQNTLKGSGSLVNTGTLLLANGQNTTTTVGSLDCSAVGNLVVWTNFIGTPVPEAAPYYNLVLGHAGSSAWNLSGAGLTIANDLSILQSGPVSAWPANGSIGGRLTYSCSGNASILPAAFSIAALSQTSGTITIPANGTLTVAGTGAGTWNRTGGTLAQSGSSTVKFTGAAPEIGGTAVNRFANLLIDSSAANAAATSAFFVTNSLTIATGASLDVTGLAGGVHTMLGNESLLSSGTLKGALTTVSGSKIFAGTDGTYATATVTGDVTMAAGSTVNLDVNSAPDSANDQVVIGGALALNNNTFNLKAPSAGAAIGTTGDYTLVTAASISGNPVLHWVTAPANAGSYSLVTTANSILLHYNAGGTLNVPFITSIALVSGELHISGTNGTPGGSYAVLGSADVSAPRGSWTTNMTGTFDASGNFSFTNSISGPSQFISVKQP